MTIAAAALPAHTTIDRLYTTIEAVDRLNITVEQVTVNEHGITLSGIDTLSIHDLTPAFALRHHDDREDVYVGSTFDGTPVTVERHRQ